MTPHQLRHAFGSNVAGCGRRPRRGRRSCSVTRRCPRRRCTCIPDPARLRAAVDAGAQPAGRLAAGDAGDRRAPRRRAGSPAPQAGAVFGHVLAGVDAGRRRRRGWPPRWTRGSSPRPAGTRRPGCCRCRPSIRCWAGRCAGQAGARRPRTAAGTAGCAGVPSRLARQGLDRGRRSGPRGELPPLPAPRGRVPGPGCQRMSPGGARRQRSGLCQAHSARFRRVAGHDDGAVPGRSAGAAAAAAGAVPGRGVQPHAARASTATARPTTCAGAPPSPPIRRRSGDGGTGG